MTLDIATRARRHDPKRRFMLDIMYGSARVMKGTEEKALNSASRNLFARILLIPAPVAQPTLKY
jgi:hypothetical protein